MDTRSSQKKSRRSSAISERNQVNIGQNRPSEPEPDLDLEQYMDRSFDHVARVRAAKEAAQRAMEAFGDVSEYDITIIQGQLKEESVAPSQSSLDFPSDTAEGN